MRGPVTPLIISNGHSPDSSPLLTGLDDLRTKAKILHRDISLSNLMCKTTEGSDSVTLILNDFDLAAYVGENGEPVDANLSKHRTGTLPFMARDILADVTAKTHYLRHDLESVFWVALWCLVKLPRPSDKNEVKRRRQMLLNWEEGGLEAVHMAKIAIITDKAVFQRLALSPEMQAYRQWISAFRLIIKQGYDAIEAHEQALADVEEAAWEAANSRRTRRMDPILPPAEVDKETWGGKISCGTILRVLEKWEDIYAETGVKGLIPYFFPPDP